MALTPIDGDPARPRRTYFGRRGPWGALFARSGNNNNTARGSNGDLTRRWAHGPANSNLFIRLIFSCSFLFLLISSYCSVCIILVLLLRILLILLLLLHY